MRVVLQRAKNAKVVVEEAIVGKIDNGFLLLVGVTHTDTVADVDYLVEKIVHLRVFEDEAGKMNQSLIDVAGQILSVSQFTLYGDTRKGRRPNFMDAAKPEQANQLYQLFNEKLREKNIQVETGIFGAMMDVSFTNDGPVTLLLDSKTK
ncbi:D-aminoacyl-tRNA deacylase [Caldibacillus lycopersici]|uniref:D-aminoacyl-tRNA deacylase n=1 Tax=Perspicuibacillus lycopersici TaxID=1325689 RepID=A0AAE3ITQ5_9BACI|nr:D-aminoacyl-tRNA deacylase [Perspicuibacillus lycopersici]MCU9613982.1 D-aminoacyl-tRNA deacylase [Perspicuibacillus lycopersici]